MNQGLKGGIERFYKTVNPPPGKLDLVVLEPGDGILRLEEIFGWKEVGKLVLKTGVEMVFGIRTTEEQPSSKWGRGSTAERVVARQESSVEVVDQLVP